MYNSFRDALINAMASIHKHTTSSLKTTFTFPNLAHDRSSVADGTGSDEQDTSEQGSPAYIPRRDDIWQSRRKSPNAVANGGPSSGIRRARQKSLSEALITIHNRRASISDNAHEIAEALKAPVSVKLIVCSIYLDHGSLNADEKWT